MLLNINIIILYLLVYFNQSEININRNLNIKVINNSKIVLITEKITWYNKNRNLYM